MMKIIFYENAHPKILLGQDNWNLIVTEKLIHSNNFPFAISKTRIGYCVHGPVEKSILKTLSIVEENTFICQQKFNLQSDSIGYKNNNSLDDLIKFYFQIDSLGVESKKKMDYTEKRAWNILEKKSKRLVNAWETALLWRRDNEVIPDSKGQALKRLLTLEKRLDRDPQYADLYYKEMDRLFECGYAIEMPIVTKNVRQWYLPHFGVTHPDKPGRLRLVFDAASKCEGVCFNDLLLKGPDLLKSLIGVFDALPST